MIRFCSFASCNWNAYVLPCRFTFMENKKYCKNEHNDYFHKKIVIYTSSVIIMYLPLLTWSLFNCQTLVSLSCVCTKSKN